MQHEDGKGKSQRGSHDLHKSVESLNAVDNDTPSQNGADPIAFHLAVSDIHELEIRKLRKRKYIMHVLFCGAAAILVFWYGFYYTKACKDNDYFTES